MIDRGKESILGVGVNVIDYDTAVASVIEAARAKRNLTLTALAVHGIMTGVFDREQRYRLNRLNLVVPDGQPVRWALNVLYRAGLPDRVYGPTLMLRVCAAAARDGLPIYLYGSTTQVIERLKINLKARFPRLEIAGGRASAFRRLSVEERNAIAEEIRVSAAAIVFVGLGCPRQEIWAYEHRETLSVPVVAVGAAFAFHAGRLAQAPRRLQDWGLEWLFRLCSEPRRLWRRYLLLNPAYVALLILQATGVRQFGPADASVPYEEMRYG